MKTVTLNASTSKLEKLLGQEYGLVVKVDVSNLENSIEWYTDKLGLIVNPNYQTSTWTQLIIPGIVKSEIGLNVNAQNAGSGGENTTFVVNDIIATKKKLESEGIKVSSIQNAGDGVLLAYFSDPDDNSLGLRQNTIQ
ncbi:lactoylglutathione lyase [Chitinophaga sp. CF118]|uniref:VOC family protein n=1 Tax=Chitinophaga sp. CF118 TaxID=1884367 RepID=UPI0008EF5A81|nr:VOC family protein [Chitinophaga sp. CF118]SFD88425.1 lactoylglutathione lyase [Chitinophaga sp. CF118]